MPPMPRPLYIMRDNHEASKATILLPQTLIVATAQPLVRWEVWGCRWFGPVTLIIQHVVTGARGPGVAHGNQMDLSRSQALVSISSLVSSLLPCKYIKVAVPFRLVLFLFFSTPRFSSLYSTYASRLRLRSLALLRLASYIQSRTFTPGDITADTCARCRPKCF